MRLYDMSKLWQTITLICILLVLSSKHAFPQQPAKIEATEYFDLGVNLQKENKIDQALEAFKKAIHLSPEYTEAHRLYQDILNSKGLQNDVKSEYKNLLRGNPESEVFHYLYGRVILSDSLDKAIEEFQNATRLNSKYYWGYHGLASAYNAKKMYDEAIIQCQEALKIDPKSNIGFYLLGRIYVAKGKLDSAVTHFKKALSLDSTYVQANWQLGLVYEEKDMKDEAIAEYKKAIMQDSTFLAARGQLGYLYEKENMLDSAKTEYQKALTMDSTDAWAHEHLGLVFEKKDLKDAAISTYQRAIEIDSTYAWAYVRLGVIYKDKNLLDDAIVEYQKAIQVDSTYLWPLGLLGEAYEKKNMIEKAIDTYKKAIRIDSTYSWAYQQLGNIYFDKGWRDEAKACYKQQIALEHKGAVYHEKLGDKYLEKDLLHDASSEYKQAIHLGSNSIFGTRRKLLAIAVATRWYLFLIGICLFFYAVYKISNLRKSKNIVHSYVKAMNMRQLWINSFKIYLQNIPEFFFIVGIFFIPWYFAYEILNFAYPDSIWPSLANLLTQAITFFSVGALIGEISDICFGYSVSISKAFRKVSGKVVLKLLGTYYIENIIIVVVLGLPFGLSYLFLSDDSNKWLLRQLSSSELISKSLGEVLISSIGWLFGVLGFLAMAFLYFRFIFSAHAVMLEDISFFKALKRSNSLVKRTGWKVFFSVTIITLITYLVPQFIFLILIFDTSSLLIKFIVNLYSHALSIALFPMAYVFITLLYYALRIRKNELTAKIELEDYKDLAAKEI